MIISEHIKKRVWEKGVIDPLYPKDMVRKDACGAWFIWADFGKRESPLGYDEKRDNWKFKYPIGHLGGKVEIHFLHYHTEEEAAEKWYRRAKRINWDNLLVFGMEQNLCTDDDIREFDKLPFERKIFFSSKPMPDVKSNCFVEEFAGLGHVGDPWKQGHFFYKALVEKINSSDD